MVKRMVVVKNEIKIKTSGEMRKPQPNAEKKTCNASQQQIKSTLGLISSVA